MKHHLVWEVCDNTKNKRRDNTTPAWIWDLWFARCHSVKWFQSHHSQKCMNSLKRVHQGGKSKYATRNYNITVNHCRRILWTTKRYPGSWNDKTLVLFDTFIRDVKRGKILQDNIFELLERSGNEIVKVKYRGVWIIVNNGYHNWSVTVPPFTNSEFQHEIRWS